MRTFLTIGLTLVAAFFVLNILTCEDTGQSIDQNKEAQAVLEAIDSGELSQAKSLLRKVEGDARWECAQILIEEYIAVDDVKNAIYVYERLTPEHCSTYEMQYDATYGHDGYEKEVCRLIYRALIENDEFERAWKYHPLEYDDENYAGNGGCRMSYISDVITYLCQSGRTMEAQQFLDEHGGWFRTHVDFGEWGEEYPSYRYDVVIPQLQAVINSNF